MSTHGYRHERLADQIRAEVAEMIAGELKDPRIGFATVARVDLSADLRHGRVFVSVLGSEESRRETLAGLASAAGYVRYELGRRLRLRCSPELVFVLDRSAEEEQQVELLLQKLKPEP